MKRSSSRERLQKYQAQLENQGRQQRWILIAIMVGFAIVALGLIVVKNLPRAPVDLNQASATELQKLPGVGPSMARDIVAGRPYQSSEDLLKVKGIGPKTLEKIRPLLKVPSN